MPTTKQVLEAIDKSIKHWQEMISWVKKQRPSDHTDSNTMSININTSWHGWNCPLCKMFCSKNLSCAGCYSGSCQLCPLLKTDNCCNNSGSIWKKVNYSPSWGSWLNWAKKMVYILKEARTRIPQMGYESDE